VAEFRLVPLNDIAQIVADSEGDFLRMKEEADLAMWDLLGQWNAAQSTWAFVSVDDGRIVGYITATVDPPDEARLELGPMYICPSARGRGLGRLQVRRLIDWASREGFRAIRATTWGRNVPSRRSLEGAGFTRIGETADHRVNGDSTVWYEWRQAESAGDAHEDYDEL